MNKHLPLLFLLLTTLLNGCKKEGFTDEVNLTCQIDGVPIKGGVFAEGPFTPKINGAFLFQKEGKFRFFMRVFANSKEKGFYRFLFVCNRNTPPQIGKRYELRNLQAGEDLRQEHPDYHIITVGTTIPIHQYADTTKLPANIRKRSMECFANRVKSGYIRFTEITPPHIGRIAGEFEVEVERDPFEYPYVWFKTQVTKGRFTVSRYEASETLTDGIGGESVLFTYEELSS